MDLGKHEKEIEIPWPAEEPRTVEEPTFPKREREPAKEPVPA